MKPAMSQEALGQGTMEPTMSPGASKDGRKPAEGPGREPAMSQEGAREPWRQQ